MAPPGPAPERSYAFENAVFVLIVPASLLLLGWVWLGRAFLGAGGWFVLIFAMTVVPVLFGALALTTALAFAQRRSPATGRLTQRQAAAHVVMWAALFGFGLFVVDFGDTEDSANSVLTVVVGGSSTMQDLSMALALGAGLIAVAAWAWLLVELAVGISTRSPRGAGATPGVR